MQGLDALEYKEHIDYDIVASTNPAFNKAIIRLNVFRHHRQVTHCLAVCLPGNLPARWCRSVSPCVPLLRDWPCLSQWLCPRALR